MTQTGVARTRLAVVLLVVLVVCGTIPAVAAAQTDRQVGGTVTVEEGETVDSLESFGGSVIVRGTVTGDVSAAGGDVRIERTGEVGGDLEAAGGSVTIAGTVEDDVDAAAGSLDIREGATVGGDVSAGAGSVVIDGTIEGDATIGAETIRLGENAAIAGNLRYDGDLVGNTDAVAGEIQQDSSLVSNGPSEFQPFASWVFGAYAVVVNLLLGAILLALFPRFSGAVANRVATSPARTGVAGLGVLVGVPILLIALAITVVGIPLSLAGMFGFALVLWIGLVYGRFAVAAWLLSAIGLGNRWVALVVGIVGGALLSRVPYVGSLLDFVILLLGLGAIAFGLYDHRRAIRERGREPTPVGSGTGRGAGRDSDEPAAD